MGKQTKAALLTYLKNQGSIFKPLDEFGPQLGDQYCIQHPPIDESDELSYLNYFCPTCEANDKLKSIINELCDEGLIESNTSSFHNIPDIRITSKGKKYLTEQKLPNKIRMALFPKEKIITFIWGGLTFLLGRVLWDYISPLIK